MTAHWIDVKEGIWKLRSEVVGFQPVSGEHSGTNLAKYFVNLCDRVGIMSNAVSKVCNYDQNVLMRSLISITIAIDHYP